MNATKWISFWLVFTESEMRENENLTRNIFAENISKTKNIFGKYQNMAMNGCFLFSDEIFVYSCQFAWAIKKCKQIIFQPRSWNRRATNSRPFSKKWKLWGMFSKKISFHIFREWTSTLGSTNPSRCWTSMQRVSFKFLWLAMFCADPWSDISCY